MTTNKKETKKSTAKAKANNNGEMSLTGHLKEMRNRIVVTLVVMIVGMVACFAYAETLVNLLTNIGAQYNYTFITMKPQEGLMVSFTISIIGGFVIAVPLLAYEIFAFCSPAMRKKEKTFMILALIFGGIFFCIGVCFAYFITMPFMLQFLAKFGAGTIMSSTTTSLQNYIDFLLLVFVIFGVIFELPVISVLLTALGLVKPLWLIKARKVVIVLIFVLAALITPPDIVSQIMVAIPIILLYQLSILLSKLVYSLKRKKAEDDEDEDDEDD